MKASKSKFFEAVAGGDLTLVGAMLVSRPALVKEVVMSGPKAMIGASSLDVALNCTQWGVCNVLLDHGADVDYVPDQGLVERKRIREWYPPLHLAIVRMVDVSQPGKEKEELGVQVVLRMVSMSLNIHIHSFDGLTPLHRACTLLLPGYDEATRAHYMDAIERVFAALLSAGANPHYSNGIVGSAASIYGCWPSARRLLRLDS